MENCHLVCFFDGVQANGASWTLYSTSHSIKSHFHCDSKRQQMFLEQIFMLKNFLHLMDLDWNFFKNLLRHWFILKWDSHLPKMKCFICFNGSLWKMMKSAFYFILKALLVLKIFKFLFWLSGHVEKQLD